MFFRSDKLFKSDLSERCRFNIFFRICKIFLDCSFTAFAGFCFYRSSNHGLNCWGYRNIFVLCGWNWLIFSVSCTTLCLKALRDLSDSDVFISIAINWYVTLLYSLFYCTDGESKIIFKTGFALKLLAAIRKGVKEKKHFTMKSLTGWTWAVGSCALPKYLQFFVMTDAPYVKTRYVTVSHSQ